METTLKKIKFYFLKYFKEKCFPFLRLLGTFYQLAFCDSFKNKNSKKRLVIILGELCERNYGEFSARDFERNYFGS